MHISGDQTERLKCEREVRRRPKRRYESPVKLPARKKTTLPPTPPSTGNRKHETPSTESALDFLKARPQLKKLEQSSSLKFSSRIREKPRTVNGEEVEDLVENRIANGDPNTWQSSEESIVDFLRRIPVQEAPTKASGPWLWVHCPNIPRSYHQASKAEKVSWMEDGFKLLEHFDLQRAKIATQYPNQEQAAITRKMAPYRDQLETDLLGLAVKGGCTTGKWMFFPKRNDLPRYWRLVATAVAERKLGKTAKVSTDFGEENVVCVYTYDFSDVEDVIRVLKELVELDLVSSAWKPIYYKCDAYTHLGIQRDNRYGLRASLFSSKDILQNERRFLKEGPVAQLKKRNKKSDELYNLDLSDDIE